MLKWAFHSTEIIIKRGINMKIVPRKYKYSIIEFFFVNSLHAM